MDCTKEEPEWQLVPVDWWRTPFSSVSWAYFLPKAPDATKDNPTKELRAIAKPPHYHESLFRNRVSAGASASASWDRRSTCDNPVLGIEDGGDALNPDLVGVQGVDEVVSSYETDVGFHHTVAWPSETPPSRPALRVEVSEEELALNKEHWDEMIQDLMGGLNLRDFDTEDTCSSLFSSPASSLHRSSSTLSSIDLTDSERSVISVSVPSTPKAQNSHANIAVKSPSPSGSASGHEMMAASPSRRLNASASAFVSSFSPCPPASKLDPVPFPSLNDPVPSPPLHKFADFTFPSLNAPPIPAVKIKKDEQGFYSQVELSPPLHQRTTSTLLPAFIHDAFARRKAPASKTRAIVDRLRSSSQSQGGDESKVKITSHTATSTPTLHDLNFLKPRLSVSEDGGDRESCLSSPSPEDDGDGWIGLGEEIKASSTAPSKARRTRDLFLALTRRRSNSSPSELSASPLEEPAPEVEDVNIVPPSRTSSPSPSVALSSTDGWIEAPALSVPPKPKRPTHSRNRKSRTSQSISQSQRQAIPPHPHPPTYTAVPAYPPPPPSYYPAYPGMPMQYAAYMQMQLHMQQQQQMHMRGAGARLGHGSRGGSMDWYHYPHPQPTAIFVPPNTLSRPSRI